MKSPLKFAKYGFSAGVLADLNMLRDLSRAVQPMGLLRQIVAMRRLRV